MARMVGSIPAFIRHIRVIRGQKCRVLVLVGKLQSCDLEEELRMPGRETSAQWVRAAIAARGIRTNPFHAVLRCGSSSASPHVASSHYPASSHRHGFMLRDVRVGGAGRGGG